MKTCKKLYHLSTVVAIISMFVVVLVGCSSGGDEAGFAAGNSLTSATVLGVAAAGAPIIGNAYLKDSANHVIGPEPIGADGSFSFNVTGLRPPFYMLAVGHVGSTDYLLYSVTTSSSGIANINPFTHLIVAAAAGDIPANVYGDPTAHPVTNEELNTSITGLRALLNPLLVVYNAGNINPISDPFIANHTQLDAVFDLITIAINPSPTPGGAPVVVVIDNLTGDVIAQASAGNLETPTIPLTPADIPFVGKITKGADRLVATQNNDGGWEWENPDTNQATGISAPNTLGVTAQGILDAYKITKKNSYLNACISTYNRLLTNSTNPDPWYHKIRGSDITFLVELSEVTGDSTYADFAKTRYQTLLNDPVIQSFHSHPNTATGLAEYLRDYRINQSALISWDINRYILGVLALNRYYLGQGFDADANLMVEVIYKSLYVNPVDFDLLNSNQNFYWFAYTGAVDAFMTTGLHLDKIDFLKATLLASQLTTGSMAGSFLDVTYSSGPPATSPDAQVTAYAVMALLKAGENPAAKKGVKYLVKTQSPNGCWTEDTGTTENTEVTSEAIQAIYNFQK
jgi:hypothetical protein